jgi:hypothetical protein
VLLMTQAPAFGFDPVAVVSQYASAIENQLLRQQADVDGLLEFQTSPDLLGTPLAALLGWMRRARCAGSTAWHGA